MTAIHKSSLSLACLLAVILGVFVAALIIPTGLSAQEEEETELAKSMQAMNKAIRKLRRQVSKPEEADAALKSLNVMQNATAMSLGQLPAKAEVMSPGQRPKFLLGYKRKMLELYTALLDIEQAILKGDHDEAKKIYKTLSTIKKEGHSTYQEEE